MKIKDVQKCIRAMENRRPYFPEEHHQRYIDGYVAAMNKIISLEDGSSNIKTTIE